VRCDQDRASAATASVATSPDPAVPILAGLAWLACQVQVRGYDDIAGAQQAERMIPGSAHLDLRANVDHGKMVKHDSVVRIRACDPTRQPRAAVHAVGSSCCIKGDMPSGRQPSQSAC
jgi:hypothetical protein